MRIIYQQSLKRENLHFKVKLPGVVSHLSQVLNVLCSLCVGNDVAVRSNQNLICDNLLPGRDLLLQTKVVEHVFRFEARFYIIMLSFLSAHLIG